MRRSLLVLIISGISTGAVASGYALWSYMSDPAESVAAAAIAPAGTASKAAPGNQAKLAALTPPPAAMPPGTSSLLAIEVARIEAGGPSVLAGRSPPNHKVTIVANGREVANVTATDEGQWSAIVPGGIEAGPLELTITSQPKEGGATVRGATRQLVVPERTGPQLAAATPARSNAGTAVTGIKAPSPRVAPQPIERPQGEAKRSSPSPARARAESEDAANKRALAEFEALVERTRKEMSAQPQAVDSSRAPVEPRVAEAPNSPPSASPSGTTYTPAAGSTHTPAVPAAPASSSSMAAAPLRATQGSSDSVTTTAQTALETRLAAALPPVAPAPAAPSSAPSSNPTPAAVQAPIPVPITFVTDEDDLTPNGERAAALLAEYLKLKRPAGITLSGHADARGSDGYNMRLSLKRLKAIERYLRAAGYSGALSLVPRGKREPYQGIDRRHLPLREIYQADRRVELRITP